MQLVINIKDLPNCGKEVTVLGHSDF